MQDQYSRTQMLLGAEAMTKLHNSRVAVFGVGGVPTISAPSAAARVPSAERWRRSCAGTDAGTTL